MPDGFFWSLVRPPSRLVLLLVLDVPMVVFELLAVRLVASLVATLDVLVATHELPMVVFVLLAATIELLVALFELLVSMFELLAAMFE